MSVETIDSEGVVVGDLTIQPLVDETEDLQEIAPCEPPTPGIIFPLYMYCRWSPGPGDTIVL